MNILLDDIPFKESLYPFGAVRSIAHIRIGILTIFEKWQFYFPGKVFIKSEQLINPNEAGDCLKFPANFIPSWEFLKQVAAQNMKIAFTPDCRILAHPWQIFEYNDWAIGQDFKMITAGRISEKLTEFNQALHPENIFIEAGATIRFSILNAESRPDLYW